MADHGSHLVCGSGNLLCSSGSAPTTDSKPAVQANSPYNPPVFSYAGVCVEGLGSKCTGNGPDECAQGSGCNRATFTCQPLVLVPAGAVCDLGGSRYCADGTECSATTSTCTYAVGAGCNSDNDCTTGAVCDSSRPQGSLKGTCAVTGFNECTQDSDCLSQKCRVIQANQGQTTCLPAGGGTCSSTADCDYGFYCTSTSSRVQGTCQATNAGAACKVNADCSSNICPSSKKCVSQVDALYSRSTDMKCIHRDSNRHTADAPPRYNAPMSMRHAPPDSALFLPIRL